MEKTIQITAGRGPAECTWVVAQVLKSFLFEAGRSELTYTVLHREQGIENGTLFSATVQVAGENTDDFISAWAGTIQWIGQSPFRKYHKRKNWFIGVNELKLSDQLTIREDDITYDTFRSGGPGGQNVNKVNTAIRAKHLPTGLFVVATDGRTQLQNKKNARKRLLDLLALKDLESKRANAQANWQNHNELERGNPVRVYEGKKFTRRR